jgi:hypothetical protein
MYRKARIGFGTICSFKHPLGSLDCLPVVVLRKNLKQSGREGSGETASKLEQQTWRHKWRGTAPRVVVGNLKEWEASHPEDQPLRSHPQCSCTQPLIGCTKRKSQLHREYPVTWGTQPSTNVHRHTLEPIWPKFLKEKVTLSRLRIWELRGSSHSF